MPDAADPAMPVVLEQLAAHRAQFLAFLAKRVGSEAVAEDLLQSSFLRAAKKASQVRDEDSAVAWFYSVLRNAVIDYYRHPASSERALDAFARELETTGTSEPILDEVCKCVSGLAEGLKPEYRQALLTIDIEGGHLTDLAAEAGISSANAATRVHRARRALRD
jgi:RNA polymerase sigma-70 factor (ECF subfamily)